MKTSIYKNNKSGVRGVSFEVRCQKYRAYIQVDKKRNYLGYFQTKEEAIQARYDAEQFSLFNKDKFKECKYPLIDFVLQNKLAYDKFDINYDELSNVALGALIKIISKYPGDETFITYAIRNLTSSFITLNHDECIKIANIYNLGIPLTNEKKYIELYLKGFSPNEIAIELGICINTTYKYLKLSIQKLKEDFKLLC